ncbi:S1C family serine protease [Vicingaceae bacterium]|nr:S1C family serine protease [Vicingaceae bacterium]
MKRILFLVLSIFIIACNQEKKENQNKTGITEKPENKITKKTELNASDIYSKSKDKVALIISYDQSGIPISQGSGFFISKDSLITNYHVIEGASRVDIKIIGEDKMIRGSQIISASEKHDIAIIKTKKEFNYFKTDSLNNEIIGSKIFTIGNPRGLEGTISEGIISAKRKEDYDLIQITAPISPGNSGGPLINEKGNVIGISTFTLTNSQNLNFAVPIKYINECTKYSYKPISKKRKKLNDKSAITVSNYKKPQLQDYEFISLKNHSANFIKSITGVLVYKGMKGEIIDYQIINEQILIPPNLAKQIKIKSFDQDNNYLSYKELDVTGGTRFKLEFRLLSYEIDE